MKISELPGQVSREVTVEKELRPVGPNEQTNISVPKLSHVSLDNILELDNILDLDSIT